jgi:methionine-S-sulfoxide reductase
MFMGCNERPFTRTAASPLARFFGRLLVRGYNMNMEIDGDAKRLEETFYEVVKIAPLILATILVLGGTAMSQPLASTGMATFAGGCFWCMEPPFDKLDGVLSTTSGYMGGAEENPTYQEVSAGSTGHAEAVQVRYDPSKVSYEKLLEVFWMQIDPTTPNRQFVDVGRQYRTAIFYHDEEQRRLAEESKTKLDKSGRHEGPIVTEIVPTGIFWPAEDYHQDYYKKNPIRYKFYRFNSGRDQYLKKVWGKTK